MPPPIPVVFEGGSAGLWRVERISPVRGESLPSTERLAVFEGVREVSERKSAWVLRGVAGHPRYVEKREKEALAAVQPPLGRAEATRAALIPIRKSAAWWELAQDERRAIFEEQSRHTGEGIKYLPAVARRLYQSRELGEPFDFLTWFEYAPRHAEAFEDLVGFLRTTPEWEFVEREVDIRLSR